MRLAGYPRQLIKAIRHYIFVTTDDEEHRTATVDHVVDMMDGGVSETHNLVAACKRCNAERQRKKSRAAAEAGSGRAGRTCRKCGGKKPTGRKHCKRCRIGSQYSCSS